MFFRAYPSTEIHRVAGMCHTVLDGRELRRWYTELRENALRVAPIKANEKARLAQVQLEGLE